MYALTVRLYRECQPSGLMRRGMIETVQEECIPLLLFRLAPLQPCLLGVIVCLLALMGDVGLDDLAV